MLVRATAVGTLLMAALVTLLLSAPNASASFEIGEAKRKFRLKTVHLLTGYPRRVSDDGYRERLGGKRCLRRVYAAQQQNGFVMAGV